MFANSLSEMAARATGIDPQPHLSEDFLDNAIGLRVKFKLAFVASTGYCLKHGLDVIDAAIGKPIVSGSAIGSCMGADSNLISGTGRLTCFSSNAVAHQANWPIAQTMLLISLSNWSHKSLLTYRPVSFFSGHAND